MGYTKEHYTNIVRTYRETFPNTQKRARTLGVMEAILVQNDMLVPGEDFDKQIVGEITERKHGIFGKKETKIVYETYDDFIFRHFMKLLSQ
jgi:hypothetical protein